MWRVPAIESEPVELDFSGSGQRFSKVTRVTAGGVQLSNALELIDFEADGTQVDVCVCCGFSGCSPGGWAAFRRLGDDVVWTPCWSLMERQGEDEFSAGAFYSYLGAPLFSEAAWSRMRQINRALPAMSELPRLRSREAVRLLQDSAPLHLLGRFPSAPALQRELLLGVASGSLEGEVHVIDAGLRDWWTSDSPVRLLASVSIAPIELLVDSFDVPTWVGVGRHQHTLALLLDGSGALLFDAG